MNGNIPFSAASFCKQSRVLRSTIKSRRISAEMTNELIHLQSEYNAFCQRVSPSRQLYAFLTKPHDDGSPHVEYIDDKFHYIVTERGSENDRRSTADTGEILYWMLNDLLFWMSVSYELKHRVEGQDCRRIMFARRIELMRNVGREFTERLEQEIALTLVRNPFVDDAAGIK